MNGQAARRRRRNRGLALPAIVAFLVLPLAGCWDRTEVNDLAIVLATGVDLGADGSVELSAQIFLPRAGGGGPQGSTGGSGSNATSDTVLRRAQGRSVAEAMNRLQGRTSRHLFWGHSEVIVIGREAAERGIRSYVDFFLRYLQFREHAYVFLSEGRASEALDMEPILERSTSEELREMGNMKLGVLVSIERLARMIEGDSRSAVLSIVKPVLQSQAGQEPRESTSVSGIAVLEGDRYKGSAKGVASYGLMLMRNELEKMVYTFELPRREGEISVRLTDAKVRLRPRIEDDGEWAIDADVRAEGDLLLDTTELAVAAPPFIPAANEAWKDQLSEQIEAAIDRCQKELKVDALGFAKEFRRRYPRAWAKNKENWAAIFPRVKVAVHVRARIERVGKSSVPQGIPEDRVLRK